MRRGAAFRRLDPVDISQVHHVSSSEVVIGPFSSPLPPPKTGKPTMSRMTAATEKAAAARR